MCSSNKREAKIPMADTDKQIRRKSSKNSQIIVIVEIQKKKNNFNFKNVSK